MRFVEDIGMFCLDRPIESSCVHRTEYCESNCYNNKLYKLYPAMYGKDVRNEAYWAWLDGKKLAAELSKRRKFKKRVRLMSRGEAFSNYGDLEKVKSFLIENPDTEIWVPTRAWRNPLLRVRIENEIMGLPNAFVMASLDPSNTADEIYDLKAAGWSTIYFGDDAETDGRYKCPKTWNGAKAFCAKCKKGCFSSNRVDIHLKSH